MKKILAVLSFVSALSVPSALAAEFAGANLPTTLDPTHAFAAFVVVLLAQIAIGDYTRRARPATRLAAATLAVASRARPDKAAHPLAA